MLWLGFTIAAVIIWASVNISDKFVLDKWVKEPLIPAIIYASLGLVSTLIVGLVRGINQISNQDMFLAIISGGFYLLMAIYYFKAVCIEEISRVIPLFYLSNFIIAIFAAIFLGEILTIGKYIGIFILIIGAVLISVKEFEKPRLDKGTFYMILAAVFTSANMLLNKFVLNHTDFWTVFSWNRIGSFIFILPIVYLNRTAIIKAIKNIRGLAFGLMGINQMLNLAGSMLITIAAAVGLVTIVSGFSAVQPLFVFIFTIILSLALPRIIKEELNRKVLTQKFIAIAFIITGAILLI